MSYTGVQHIHLYNHNDNKIAMLQFMHVVDTSPTPMVFLDNLMPDHKQYINHGPPHNICLVQILICILNPYQIDAVDETHVTTKYQSVPTSIVT